ncbi:MAG TPA: histidine phosphatase family protein [Verrucomicrobiae bacterium]|nr:histidine phosphatase family protein [Verrucomicrobiae bacterium]
MDKVTRLYLLRHGEVAVDYHRIFGGKIDMDLSPLGHTQAQRLADTLQPVRFEAIYASPMKRAQQTLAPLSRSQGKAAVTLPDLREVDFGAWTGLKWEQVLEQHGMHATDWLHHLEEAAIRDGDTAATFRARVEPSLQRIIAETSGQTVAVVCHGGVVRMILSILLHLPLKKMSHFEIDYASMTVVDLHARRAEVQVLNFTPWRDLPAHLLKP